MINLVPTPKKAEKRSDKKFSVLPKIYSHHGEFEKYLSLFKEMFYLANEIEFSNDLGGIELFCDKNLPRGKYTIDSGEVIKVYASEDEGILYALSSLIQLIDMTDGPETGDYFIEDYPEKSYRSMMIDLGRQWHPFSKLLKYVDLCFLYKIKFLNIHFADTNLYTLPSKVFPKLSSKGKHYSFSEIETLNTYAKERGIILVPEFECPGHAPILNQNYPEVFSDVFETESGTALYTEVGVKIETEELVCAGSEKSRNATKALLKEILDMFPDSPYINIGGDEANINQWNDCKVCREYMKSHGLKDEKELYCDYVADITKYVLSLGRTPIVWEGFPKEGCHMVPKETIVIAWESHYHMAYDLLDAGFRIINASWQPLYIVPSTRERWNSDDILNWNVYNWQHFWSESEAFLNPINVAPTEKVLGGMLCVWEMTFEQEIAFVMENLSALSERLWTVKRVCSSDEFRQKQRHLLTKASRIIQDR